MIPSPWQPLYCSPSITLGDFRCPHQSAAVSREECSDSHNLAFVRRGMFVKHVRGRDVVADSNQVLFFNRGETYRVSHPVCTGDRCTTLSLSDLTLREALAAHDPAAADCEQRPFSLPAAPVDSPTFLQHRLLVASLSDPDHESLAVDELVFDLVDSAFASLRRQSNTKDSAATTETSLVHDELVERVKHVLAAHLADGISLDRLARLVHSSPYHLSRVFRKGAGIPIHGYLVKLRLRHALDHLLNGERDLTRLALHSGFSDHSHFTNAFRREFAMPPSACRTMAGRRRLRELGKKLQAGGRR